MESFGFEKKDIQSSNFDKFKGEKGKTYVVGFARENPEEIFMGVKQHFSQRLSKGWQCLSKGGEKSVCCTHDYDGNEAKWRVGTVIVIYRLDEDDKIKGIQELKPWVFGAPMYENLKKIYKEYGLVDLSLTCTDTTFQNFTILPKKICAWVSDEKTKALVESKSEKHYDTLPKLFNKKISEAEIKEHLGIGGDGADDASSDMDLSDLSNSLED